MIIGVTGAEGRLGSELVRRGCAPLVCDITDLDKIEMAMWEVKPDVVINCAAYTNVDGAELDQGKDEAIQVNTMGVDNIRQVYTGPMIHISTDYVFSGKGGPYHEGARPFPSSGYGYSKYGGEVAFLNPFSDGDVLVRTTGLYGGPSGKHDFAKLILDRLQNGVPLKVTSDLQGNQTYVPHLAEGLLKLVSMKDEPRPAILHIASDEVISRYEFAKMLADEFDLPSDLLLPTANTGVSNWTAPRPTRGGLMVRRAQRFGIPIYSIRDGLEAFRESYT